MCIVLSRKCRDKSVVYVLLMLQVLYSTQQEPPSPVRVQYDNKNQFKQFAKQLGIMEDLKVSVCGCGM